MADRRKEAALHFLYATKGTKDMKKSQECFVGIDSPAYFMEHIDLDAPENKTSFSSYAFGKKSKEDKLLEIKKDKDYLLSSEVEYSEDSLVDFDLSLVAEEIGLEEVSKKCRMEAKLVKILFDRGIRFYKDGLAIYCKNKKGGVSYLPRYINEDNNIFFIKKQGADSGQYLVDGFTTVKGGTVVKNVYISTVAAVRYINIVKVEGFKVFNNFGKWVEIKSATFDQIMKNLIWKTPLPGITKFDLVIPGNTYSSYLGGADKEEFNLNKTVLNSKGQVCWLLESDEPKTVNERVNLIKSNPCAVASSTTQGERFKIMASVEARKEEEARFIDGKYNVDCTVGISMKKDKPMFKSTVVFMNIADGLDNNLWGNCLQSSVIKTTGAEVEHSRKIYAVDKEKRPVRVKYMAHTAYGSYEIKDTLGNQYDNWLICPVSENSNETYELEDKDGNIYQLAHMGYVPEVFTINGIECIGFRDIQFYEDYINSSDYNLGSDKETKLYSTMTSSIKNHLNTAQGNRGEVFEGNIRARFKNILANDVFNIAGLEVKNVSLKMSNKKN